MATFATDPDGTASRILAVVLPPYFHTARQAVMMNNDPLAIVKKKSKCNMLIIAKKEWDVLIVSILK